MSKKQFILGTVLAAVLGGMVVLAGIQLVLPTERQYQSIEERQKVQLTKFANPNSEYTVAEGLNFIHAAEKVTPGVVHIRSRFTSNGYNLGSFEQFFRNRGENPSPESLGSGSGVLISDDGYIVTNNHVIEKADEVEVILNDNRSYVAKIVGTDPQTDLALLKIDAKKLHYVSYGNSDNLKIGEWVLAVGNPFKLTSTVTAGIVSAKARNIGILRDGSGLQIESFIQTDAAVNPGNSGGALINLKGELIGINTAIATPTGTYAGYSFAVPVTLVKKVIDDLLEYGKVQRGLLGIRIGDVNAQVAEAEGLDVVQGVYVSDVNDDSAADEAGIEKGDVIIGINDVTVNNVSELQELVARNRPGDKVKVFFLRNGKKINVTATLKNTAGNTKMMYKTASSNVGGAEFDNLSKEELNKYNIKGGVKLTKLGSGKWKDAGVKEGFIITSVDKISISDVEEFIRVMNNKAGGLLVQGFYHKGEQIYYGLGW